MLLKINKCTVIAERTRIKAFIELFEEFLFDSFNRFLKAVLVLLFVWLRDGLKFKVISTRTADKQIKYYQRHYNLYAFPDENSNTVD